MPKTSQPTILTSCGSNDPKTGEAMLLESSQAKSITRNITQTALVSSTSQYFVLQAEIMWCLDVIMIKYSYNSNSDKSDLFLKMFSDSNIAKNLACGKIKCSYIVKFGLLPYFLELLNSELNHASHYVALSYNNAAKERLSKECFCNTIL